MDEDDDRPFGGSRPSSVLSPGSFKLGKFLAATAALAATGGGGVWLGYALAGRDAASAAAPPEPEPEPPPVAVDLPPAPPEPAPDLAPVDPPGGTRFDIPDPWMRDPSDAPAPGPEVEVPHWD